MGQPTRFEGAGAHRGPGSQGQFSGQKGRESPYPDRRVPADQQYHHGITRVGVSAACHASLPTGRSRERGVRRPYLPSSTLTVMMALAMSVPSLPSALSSSRPPTTTCTVARP